MITGVDTVFVVAGAVASNIGAFLDDLQTRWPNLRVAIGDDGETFRSWSLGSRGLPESAGQLLIARDEEMEAFWEDSGYELDSNDEGPLAIAYQAANWTDLKIKLMQDPYLRSGFSFSPYDASLIGRNYYLVSIVTPPVESDFTQSVLGQLARFLAEGAK
jgi:hypothetical protein